MACEQEKIDRDVAAVDLSDAIVVSTTLAGDIASLQGQIDILAAQKMTKEAEQSLLDGTTIPQLTTLYMAAEQTYQDCLNPPP